MIIKVTGSNTTIGNFYDQIAIAQKLPITYDVRYDCRKVNVAKNIQENIFDYYKKLGTSASDMGMLWICYGPKVNEDLKQDEVELEEGWYMNV